jgi:hypothetical protein
MVRLATLGTLLTVLAVPAPAQARKPLSAATLAALSLRPPPALRLDLPLETAAACRICGSGIPDARVGRNLLLGADSARDRLRLYVKRDDRQWSVDVSTNSALLGYGFRF